MRKLIEKFLPIIMIIFIFSTSTVQGKEQRKIYIGDIIKLSISNEYYTIEEIKEKFKAFDIVNLEEDGDKYSISIRTFEVGSKTINLGDKEIEIQVSSTLEGREDGSIIEGDSSYNYHGINGGYLYYLLRVLAIFVVALGAFIFRKIVGVDESKWTPAQRFWKKLDGVKPEDENSINLMKKAFKKYLEESYGCRISGDTSRELIPKLLKVKEIKPYYYYIKTWFMDCDKFTFSKNGATMKERNEIYQYLMNLIQAMEYKKEVENI